MPSGELRIVSSLGFLDEIIGQAEVTENSLANLVARESVLSCPMKEASKVGSFAKLDHCFGEIVGQAWLAMLVDEERWAFALAPSVEELFVYAAGSAKTIAVEERYSDNGCEFFGRLENALLGIELLLSVVVWRIRGVGCRIRGGVPVEYLIA